MRPRVFPAEDARSLNVSSGAPSTRFNEAAGIPRGRRPDDVQRARRL